MNDFHPGGDSSFAQYLHREHQYLRYASWNRNGKAGEVDLIQLSPNFRKAYRALEVKVV